MERWREYDLRYAIYHRKEMNNWEFKEIFRILSPRPGERILDFGCGTGEFCHLLKTSPGVFPEGIDKNRTAIEIASRSYPHIPFKSIELSELEVRTYDAVTLIEVIEHLTDPLYTLQSLKDVLKKDGRIVLSTPNRWAFIHKLKSAIIGYDYLYDPLHIHIFNPKELSSLFVKAGLTVDFVYTKPLGIPFLRYVSKSLYWNVRSGSFGTYIFLRAHR